MRFVVVVGDAQVLRDAVVVLMDDEDWLRGWEEEGEEERKGCFAGCWSAGDAYQEDGFGSRRELAGVFGADVGARVRIG